MLCYVYGFTGRSSPKLGLLAALNSNFNLGHNALAGAVPSQFGQLAALTFGLFLESNSVRARRSGFRALSAEVFAHARALEHG